MSCPSNRIKLKKKKPLCCVSESVSGFGNDYRSSSENKWHRFPIITVSGGTKRHMQVCKVGFNLSFIVTMFCCFFVWLFLGGKPFNFHKSIILFLNIL